MLKWKEHSPGFTDKANERVSRKIEGRHPGLKYEVFKRYVLSYYHLNKFEYEVCLNFQIFMNKVLRKFLASRHLRFFALESPIDLLTMKPDRSCKYPENTFKVYYPKDIVRQSSKKLSAILNFDKLMNVNVAQKSDSLLDSSIGLSDRTSSSTNYPYLKLNVQPSKDVGMTAISKGL